MLRQLSLYHIKLVMHINSFQIQLPLTTISPIFKSKVSSCLQLRIYNFFFYIFYIFCKHLLKFTKQYERFCHNELLWPTFSKQALSFIRFRKWSLQEESPCKLLIPSQIIKIYSYIFIQRFCFHPWGILRCNKGWDFKSFLQILCQDAFARTII